MKARILRLAPFASALLRQLACLGQGLPALEHSQRCGWGLPFISSALMGSGNHSTRVPLFANEHLFARTGRNLCSNSVVQRIVESDELVGAHYFYFPFTKNLKLTTYN